MNIYRSYLPRLIGRAGSSLATIWILAGACSRPLRTSSFPTDEPISYSNVKTTSGADPHVYGTRVEICRRNGAWAGFMSEYLGSPADPSVARLDDLKVSEQTGSVRFTAQMSTGATLVNGLAVPTFSVIEFIGQSDGSRMLGVVTKKAVGGTAREPGGDSLDLRRERRDSARESCDRWQQSWAERLQFLRGRSP